MRKVLNRPTIEELNKLLETNSMVGIGKMFGVSDNAVRKWFKPPKAIVPLLKMLDIVTKENHIHSNTIRKTARKCLRLGCNTVLGYNRKKTKYCSRNCYLLVTNDNSIKHHDLIKVKWCCGCKAELDINAFGMKYKAKNKRADLCKMCLYKYQMNRWRKLKVQMISEKGGCCNKCGFTGHPAAFDFHHLHSKDDDWNTVRKKSIEKIRLELSKCLLLCANCHRVEHAITKIGSQ